MGGLSRRRPAKAGESTGYIELHARSAFSMLDGASTPEALARQAAELGLEALALTDLDDVGGAVRFATACARHGLRPIFGGELTLRDGPVVLLCEDERGWANLATLITRGRTGEPRGLPVVDDELLSAHTEGLICLSGGRQSPAERARQRGGDVALRRRLGELGELFRGSFYVEVHDHRLAEDVARIDSLLRAADALDLPWIVAGDVRHGAARDKLVHDVLLCLRDKTTVSEAGDLLFPNDARRLRAPAEVGRTWRDAPAGVLRTLEVAERCRFRLLHDLRPSLPRFPLPPGIEDGDAYLAQLVRDGMHHRGATSAAHDEQVRHELEVIRQLGLAGYFLIVHDIVRFAQRADILVQGRGSAANSVVCYCLGITAVDPVTLGLLFERFLSQGRSEPPDIDIDVAHRDREGLLQYVYERYGRDHAAMVCEVISWRGKSAVRDAARVLGLPAETGDRLAREVGSAVPTDAEAEGASAAADALLRGGLERAGLDPRNGRVRALIRVLRGLEGLPRHRSIHVGGFVLTGERLSSVVPIESAAMAERTVIQWDKDDLGPIGLVKIDLLGLGMLTLLSDALGLIERQRGEVVELHSLPPDDAETFAMIREADTVGVFQIESRAQMSALPRNAPRRFYDLVVQVALIRPGPIQGQMVHPYLRRRRGQEPVSYLHPLLEPVLERTLGIPLFQEQGMKVAIAAAGFSPAQADELRRAMGSKRSQHRMARLSLELLQGMEKNGIARSVAERIVKQLAAFANYGFPESHAASFALLVYASCYLKRHYVPEFYAAILNAQPMGFYPVGTLVTDARRHGLEVRPPDVTRSEWDSTLEGAAEGAAHPSALRLGLRLVRGLGKRARTLVEGALAEGPPPSIEAFARRSGLPRAALEAIAKAGAFDTLAGDRRRALWEVLRVARRPAGPFDLPAEDATEVVLQEVSAAEATVADYATVGASTRHPMEFLRARCDAAGIPPLGALSAHPAGNIRVVGLVNSRQRPMTAKGFVFLALEDETGMVNVVVRPDLFERRRDVIVDHPVLVVSGKLERRDDVINVIAEAIRPVRRRVPGAKTAKSHDFH